MSEYALFLASACVTVVTNLLGRVRPKRPPRFLVVKLDHMGDVLLATPAIRALKASFPDAAIDALVAPGAAAALEGNPAISRLLFYDSRRYRRPGGEPPRGPGALRTMRDVARGRYTTVVELRGDAWTLLLPALTGAARRVDRGSVRTGSWLARRLAGSGPAGAPPHEVETNMEIVRPLLGAQAPGTSAIPPVEVHVSSGALASLRRKVSALGVDLDAPYVCIQPGATWRPRAWRPERFAAIADWMLEHYHAQVLVLGSAEERDVGAAVRAHVKRPGAYWLFGTLTWSELAALFSRARLFLGNDGGPAHLAAACATPSVALFGPQEPGRFRPWSERSIVLHHRVHCCPCRQVVCLYPENPCVNRIELQEVQSEVRRLLDPTDPPR